MPNGKKVEDEASRKAKEELARSVRDKFDAYKKANNITQMELAAKIGVSQNTISSWLSPSKGGISGANLMRLAKAMGVSMDYLAGITDIEPDDEAREITALRNILHFDALKGTLTISSALADYLKGLETFEKAIASLNVDEATKEAMRKTALVGLHLEYEKAQKGNDVYSVTYTLRPVPAPIPAPEAGSINPINRAKK